MENPNAPFNLSASAGAPASTPQPAQTPVPVPQSGTPPRKGGGKIILILLILLLTALAVGYFVFPVPFYNSIGKYLGLPAPQGAQQTPPSAATVPPPAATPTETQGSSSPAGTNADTVSGTTSSQEGSSTADDSITTNLKSSNIFNPLSNKAGDSIAGLKVVSIGPVGKSNQVAADNVDAKFSGSATLSGAYDYSFSDFEGGDIACFTLTDLGERAQIPVLIGVPDQNTRFCFSNLQKAKDAFGPAYGNGQATITIDNYELIYAGAEVVNQAELVSVVSKTPASTDQGSSTTSGGKVPRPKN